jgi:hypothetical protein
MNRGHDEHLSAERLQAFLDGELGAKARGRVEEHLVGCVRCSSELEVWRSLFGDLDGLRALRPHEGFAHRVMADVRLPEPLSLAARIRQRLGTWSPGAAARHLGPAHIQDLAEGFLSGRQVARAEAHLRTCATCSSEVGEWRSVFRGLDGLGRLSPSEDFAAAVMAQVQVPAPVAVAAGSPVGIRVAAARLVARVGRLLPRTRRAWAALSGIAVTPAAVLSLLLYVVFSHPTLTPSALASFVWWQVSDLAATGWASVSAAFVESGPLYGVYSLIETLASAPVAVAMGALAYSVVGMLALRVLYRNLNAAYRVDGVYARVTTP